MLNYFEENNTIAGKCTEEYDNKMYDNLTTETNWGEYERVVYSRRIATLSCM